MTKISLDRATLSKLDGLRHRVEFYDDSGRKLGVFTPTDERPAIEDAEPRLNAEQLSLREKETRLYSTQEVLRHLEKLERSS